MTVRIKGNDAPEQFEKVHELRQPELCDAVEIAAGRIGG
jgi:hypothetical protein